MPQILGKMKRVVILASGTGSNAETIIKNWQDREDVAVVALLSNKEEAKALAMAEGYDIMSRFFDREERKMGKMIDLITQLNPDLIVLAGYLLKIPTTLIDLFPNKIINIHPALLPKYGGKGMYGMNVHEAVYEADEKESGITIHYVNENYDEGNIIAQFSCNIEEANSAKEIQQKVLQLEHKHYTEVIEQLLDL